MAIITLDFETFYRSKKDVGTPGEKYSLRGMTYEEYIRSPLFKVIGAGIKIDNGPPHYYYEDIEAILKRIFAPGNNHTMICHNIKFDGAVLSWYYGLGAAVYWDTQDMSKALWAQCSASLDQLAKRLFPDDKTKRKGKELASFDGIRDLTPAQQKIMGGYCTQDVELTFDCFATMYPYFPNDELELIDLTAQMFIHPAFILNRDVVQAYQASLLKDKADKIKASGLNRSLLASSKQFADYLLKTHNIIVPMKHSPTPKNPDNHTLALAKDDLEFLKIQADHPGLKHIWAARLAVTSNGELSRCTRVLSHAEKSHINPDGKLAMPLGYCSAHTKRFGGTNSINVQNFKRGSPIRLALEAPPGYKVLVRDLSNIEGRMNAWFNEQEDKLLQFKNGDDIYNALATSIYGYQVFRKKPEFDLEGRVGKIAELGLGYQMGTMSFLKQLLIAGVVADEPFAARVVATWRGKNAAIKRGWGRCEQFIFDMARKDLEPYTYKCITIEKGRIKLPSGLYMTYPGLVLRDDHEGRRFEYWNGDFMKSVYGGLLDENIIQAISRVIMTWMMLNINRRIKAYGARVALNVHDEIVAIAPDEHVTICMSIMEEEMARCPDWCNDGSLVLTSEGGYAQNYSK